MAKWQSPDGYICDADTFLDNKKAKLMEPYFDLGEQSFPITTDVPEAQIWFDRGLIWCYGFNHEEAESCFRMAIELDDQCAMAYWGLAFAVGPNYNLPWSAFTEKERAEMVAFCYDTIRVAQTKLAGKSELEAALINALARRFQASQMLDTEFDQWNDEYADAMRALYRSYSGQPDLCTLTVDALMARTPWLLWDLQTGAPNEDADTLEVKAMLEQVMSQMAADGETPHCGILHMYIHLMEMSSTPEVALPASDALRDLIPDAGHLRHMPSHIDVLCGHYEAAILANEKSHAVNELYADLVGRQNFYTIYRCHDIHFIMYAAMFLGQSQKAFQAAEEMVSMVPPDLLIEGKEYLGNMLEGFVAMAVHAYIRFGEWQTILEKPMPADPEKYCVTTTLLYYAKGVAHAVLGEIGAAERAKAAFEDAYALVPEKRLIFNNEARDILDVAREMLYGELDYRKQSYESAFAHLNRSVELHDNLKYTEPWVWMQPTRHALGALLLEQGQVEEAAAIYKADLGLDNTLSRPFQHHNNIWSLHGYHECLLKLGQEAEAAAIQLKLADAQSKADIPIQASCFCRLEHGCCEM